MRKAKIKRCCTFNLLNIVVSQFNAQSINTSLNVYHVTDTNNWKDIWRFVKNICERYAGEGGTLTPRNPLQDCANIDIRLGNFPSTSFLNSLLLFSLKLSTTQSTPGAEAHALITTHGDDVSFKVASGSRPSTLVDAESSQAMISSIFIGLTNYPGWRVADTKIKNLALLDECIQ